jgi:hypothetical protein
MTGVLDWFSSLFAGKVTLANIFSVLNQVVTIVTGVEERLGKIETRLDKLELNRALDKVADSSPALTRKEDIT